MSCVGSIDDESGDCAVHQQADTCKRIKRHSDDDCFIEVSAEEALVSLPSSDGTAALDRLVPECLNSETTRTAESCPNPTCWNASLKSPVSERDLVDGAALANVSKIHTTARDTGTTSSRLVDNLPSMPPSVGLLADDPFPEPPCADTLHQYLQPGGTLCYLPRPEWFFSLDGDPCPLDTNCFARSNEWVVVRGISTRDMASMAQAEAQPAVFGKERDCVLHVAIRENATEAALELIRIAVSTRNDCILEAVNVSGVTPLILAAQKGNVEVVRALLGERVNLSTVSLIGTTAVFQAAHFGHADILQLILQSARPTLVGTLVEAANTNQTTPLMRAAQEGHGDAMRVLLQAGAAVNRRNRVHITALMLAAQRGHAQVCRQLIQAGAEVNANTDEQQTTALLMGSKRGHVEVVRVLVAAGCNLWFTDRRGRTARQVVKHQLRNRILDRSSMTQSRVRRHESFEKTKRLIDLLDPETQVSLMQSNARLSRSWEITKTWNLLQQDRAEVKFENGMRINIRSVSDLYNQYRVELRDRSVAAPFFSPHRCSTFRNTSTEALLHTMELPFPMVQAIAEYLPTPKLWRDRLATLESICSSNANIGVIATLDFIDDVLEECGFLEACDVALVPAPMPYHNWRDWKRMAANCTVSGDVLDREADFMISPARAKNVLEAVTPRPRNELRPTRVELRRQVGYIPLLAQNCMTLGHVVLRGSPFHWPPRCLHQLVRISDVVSLSRRMQGNGVYFGPTVAADLLKLAWQLTVWQENREREASEE